MPSPGSHHSRSALKVFLSNATLYLTLAGNVGHQKMRQGLSMLIPSLTIPACTECGVEHNHKHMYSTMATAQMLNRLKQ